MEEQFFYSILGQYSATLHRGLDGKFGFALRNGKIIEIDPGNPTVRTKMKVGDRLIAINETSYTNDKDAIRKLIGSKNENMVKLTLSRPSSGKLIEKFIRVQLIICIGMWCYGLSHLIIHMFQILYIVNSFRLAKMVSIQLQQIWKNARKQLHI